MDTSFQQSRWTIPLTQRPLLREALQSDVEQARARYHQRQLVREICSLPEVRALPPQDFVIAFKHAVNDVATELGIEDGRDRELLLSRLVTISIEEFFQKDGHGDGDGDGHRDGDGHGDGDGHRDGDGHSDGDGQRDGDGHLAPARSWTERLHLSAIMHPFNVSSHAPKKDGNPKQSRDEDCRGSK